jgi:hypothetical protein
MQDYSRTRLAHRLSAAFVGTFVLVHLANHVVALQGIDAHQAFLNLARTV